MALSEDPRDCARCSPTRLCFGHKAKTLVFGSARQVRVREFRHPQEGYRIKQTRDDATKRGNTVTEHAKGDRVDLMARPDTIQYKFGRASG